VREQLVDGLTRDYGVHAYGKWKGAFWRLASLVDLGVSAGRAGVEEAAEQVLVWLTSPARLRRIHKRRIEGRVRRCASQDGLGIYACLRLGFRDGRLDTLAESLVETQWPDGGWNCDLRPEASHSSFNETWGPILGLAEYGAVDEAGRGAEFLLRHRVAFSERTGLPAHPAFFTLRYPPYWHYDLVVGLRTLLHAGRLGDRRAADALDLLDAKRLPEGTWRVEGRWWKRPGSKGSNVEAVDWGETADDLLTEHAAEVLRAAGRL
jgi:hypothetical protein